MITPAEIQQLISKQKKKRAPKSNAEKREYMRQYRAKNKEHINARKRQIYAGS